MGAAAKMTSTRSGRIWGAEETPHKPAAVAGVGSRVFLAGAEALLGAILETGEPNPGAPGSATKSAIVFIGRTWTTS